MIYLSFELVLLLRFPEINTEGLCDIASFLGRLCAEATNVIRVLDGTGVGGKLPKDEDVPAR